MKIMLGTTTTTTTNSNIYKLYINFQVCLTAHVASMIAGEIAGVRDAETGCVLLESLEIPPEELPGYTQRNVVVGFVDRSFYSCCFF